MKRGSVLYIPVHIHQLSLPVKQSGEGVYTWRHFSTMGPDTMHLCGVHSKLTTCNTHNTHHTFIIRPVSNFFWVSNLHPVHRWSSLHMQDSHSPWLTVVVIQNSSTDIPSHLELPWKSDTYCHTLWLAHQRHLYKAYTKSWPIYFTPKISIPIGKRNIIRC